MLVVSLPSKNRSSVRSHIPHDLAVGHQSIAADFCKTTSDLSTFIFKAKRICGSESIFQISNLNS